MKPSFGAFLFAAGLFFIAWGIDWDRGKNIFKMVNTIIELGKEYEKILYKKAV